MNRRSSLFLATLLATSGALAQEPKLQPFAAPGAPWKLVGLPQQTKPFTQFSVVDLDGKRALKVEANESYGNLVHPLQLNVTSAHLAWQWRIDAFIEGADLKTKAGDDTVLKVCVFFDLPIEKVPFADRQLLR